MLAYTQKHDIIHLFYDFFYLFILFFFFFSSRRRHTRCSRDWSSDVCSSDLPAPIPMVGIPSASVTWAAMRAGTDSSTIANDPAPSSARASASSWRALAAVEIGRASCRERVWVWVVAVDGVKKKMGERDDWVE